ncbi:MAG: Com family DNA-binding transcriptional regulator [Pseudomonadota bacterium]
MVTTPGRRLREARGPSRPLARGLTLTPSPADLPLSQGRSRPRTGAAKVGSDKGMLEEIRCSGCGKLLFKMEHGALAGTLSIKCPRCGAFNNLRPSASPSQKPQDGKRKDTSCGCLSPQKS